MKIQKFLYPYLRFKLFFLSVTWPKKCGNYAVTLFSTPPVKFKGRFVGIFEASEPLSFKLNKVKINGYRIPSKGKNKVLLLHGFCSSIHKFEILATAFSQNNYEVLAFDAPAHGISEGKTVNAIEYCNMIQKINETYGPIDCYVAHSFGGLAVCLALEKIPHSENTVLALIAPAAETTTAIKNAFALLKIHSGKIANLMTESIIEKTDKTPEWFSIRRAIKNIHSPILWVQDSEDYITPMTDVDKVINDQPANVRFYITHGLGHQKIYRNHKVVEDIVLFSNSILQEKNT